MLTYKSQGEAEASNFVNLGLGFMHSATVVLWNVLDLNLLMKFTFFNWINLYSLPKWNGVETA